MQQFDPNRPGLAEGAVTLVRVTQPHHVTQGDSNLVIDPTKPLDIHVEWEVFGTDMPIWLGAADDQWRVEVFAESLGPGPEIRVGPVASADKSASIPCTVNAAQPNCFKWETDVSVASVPQLPEGNPGGPPGEPSGLYRIVVVVFLNSSVGGAGFDLAGFRGGPVILIENPQ